MCSPRLIEAFEDGTLNLYSFNHKQHLYVAWIYLHTMPMQEGLDKYCKCLKSLLDSGGYGKKFNYEVTKSYFEKLHLAMKNNPNACFEDIVELLVN